MSCSGNLTISMFGSLLFLGFAIGSVTLPNLSDKYGRKYFILVSMAVMITNYIIVLLLPKGKDHYSMVYVIMTTLFLQGLATSARYPVGYCYLLEFYPEKQS
jgi:MFS family permease